jgi:hypothetical protein
MSLKTYHNITIEEINEILRADKGWLTKFEPGTKEIIKEFPLSESPHIVIRVCTGILPSGKSRGCGKDAIRVYALDTNSGKGYIKTKRVYRIGTWSKNLHRVVVDCFYQALGRRDRELFC